jgi:hypothetical protein
MVDKKWAYVELSQTPPSPWLPFRGHWRESFANVVVPGLSAGKRMPSNQPSDTSGTAVIAVSARRTALKS